MEADPKATADAAASTVFGVLGTATSLLVVGALMAVLAFLSFGIVPLSRLGAASPAPLFRGGEAPAGFRLVEDETFPSRERLRRWVRESDPTAADDPGELAPIAELFTIDVPSRAQARRLFEAEQASQGFGPPREDDDTKRLQRWERTRDFAWHSTIRSDEVAWGGWRSEYRVERSFRKDGTWQDAIRLDLSHAGVNRVLFVLYPEGIAADEDSLRTLCTRLEIGVDSSR